MENADGSFTYTKTINVLAGDDYQVTEVIKDVNGKVLVSQKYALGTSDASTGRNNATTEKFSVEKDSVQKVAYENIYSCKGQLVITKTIEGDVTKEEAEGALKFEVTVNVTENGKSVTKYVDKNGKLSSEVVQLTLADFVEKDGKYTLTLDKLTAGAYSVKETVYDIDGFNVAVSNTVYDNDGNIVSQAAKNGQNVSVNVQAEKSSKVEYNDAYTRDKGELTITKKLSGDVTPEEAMGALTFTVVNSDGKYLDKDGKLNDSKVILTLADFVQSSDKKTYTLSFTGDKSLNTDTYVVTETNSAIKGYRETVSYSLNNGKSVEGNSMKVAVEKNDKDILVIEDKYEAITEVTVHVTDQTTGEDIPNAEVVITYPDGTKENAKTDEDGKVNLEDVPEGTYTVEIVNIPDGYTVAENQKTSVDVEKGAETSVDPTLTNSGALLIIVEDENTGDKVPGAVVEVKLPDNSVEKHITDENGQITKYTEKDSDGYYTAISGIYEIKVVDVPDGYTVTVGKTNEVSVVAGVSKEFVAKVALDAAANNDTSAPGTGDSNQPVMMIILMIVSMGCLLITARSKKQKIQ